MAAGPASPSIIVPFSRSSSEVAYSRTLDHVTADEEDARIGNLEARTSEDETDDDSEDEPEEEEKDVDGDAPCAVGNSSLDCKHARTGADVVSLTSQELAQIQKRQAWLRGGQGSSDASDTASTRSTRRKSVRQPGLLERLLLPNTSAVAQRSPSSRSVAATRPATRRRHTVDLSTQSVTSESPHAAANRTASTRSRASPRQSDERKSSRTSVQSTSSTTTTPASPVAAKVECVTCMDDLPKNRTALLDCKHRMCHSCLKRIFTLSTTDPQLMPPKCCTENMIPLRHVDKLFNTTFKALWNRKYAEYTTKHRLYCPTKGCGKWIKPKHIDRDLLTGRKRGTCKDCKTKVCQKCGLKWHGGRECENDESTKRVLDLGKEEGWQRCYSCRAMVQLSEGCNHMRCRCNAEFCMVCGQKWKTCDCPWFNLPPELGVDGFLDPGQALPLPPLDIRIGDLPPPPPLLEGFEHFLNPRSNRRDGPIPFRDRRDMPLDPLNPGDLFRPENLGRPRERRRRTVPAVPLSSREQEAADEALARRLQDQEYRAIGDQGRGEDDAAAQLRRRASRRERRRVYAVTADDELYEIQEGESEHRVR